MKIAVSCALSAAALLLVTHAGAQTLSGSARVVDGDTLQIGQTRIRIFGIDAPENGQACGEWLPGPEATTYLSAFIGGREVTCEKRDTDRYGRIVATCSVGGSDLGALMVSAGWAWAFTRYSRAYEAQEATAQAAGIGVHGRGCNPPWAWRAGQQRH